MAQGWQSQNFGPEVLLEAGFLALDPHNTLHAFVVLPLLAAAVVVGAAAILWGVQRRWKDHAQQGVDLPDRISTAGVRVRYGLVGFLVWMTLSTLLILDLAGSMSLYPLFSGIYAVGMIVLVLVLLHPVPTREKALAAILLLSILFSVRAVDWNSRKTFLRDLRRVEVGMTENQVDRIMGDYRNETGLLNQADRQGRMVSGTVSYLHTSEDWGNSDIGMLTYVDGRVVDVSFLPD